MLRLWLVWNNIKTRVREVDGQTAVEYTLLLALVALAIILTSPDVYESVETIWSRIMSGLGSVATEAE